jgi:hypothetical protein
VRERPDVALLLRWEQEHFEQVARKQRFLAAHPDILICYSMQVRGWAAAWQRNHSLIAAEYDLRTLMNVLEKLGWLAELRDTRGTALPSDPEPGSTHRGKYRGRHRSSRPL